MGLSPELSQNLPSIKELIYVKTNVGGWFFDAFIRMDHVTKLKLTEHPVQTGSNITDHAFLEPRELTMEIAMSDTAESLVTEQFTGHWSRSVKAYEIMKDLQAQRVPIQVLTKLGLYTNMMIETLSVPDDYLTLYGLRATLTLREVIVAETKTVKLSTVPHITDSTNLGTKEPQPIDESIASQFNGKVGGFFGG